MNNEIGFLYRKGSENRIPYWVTVEQAKKLAQEEGGTVNSFWMKLPGYGIMNPVEWEFRKASVADIEGRQQWKI